VTDHRLGLVVAIARNGVIGTAGDLPWSYPEDRAHFEVLTLGHVVVMGRRTWEETREPLAGRTNVVVSRGLSAPPEGVRVVPSLGEALALAWSLDEMPFVIGGTRLFEEALPFVTEAFVTRIPESPEGDTRFVFDSRGFLLHDTRLWSGGLAFEHWKRST
jgi:dihydrofolate reductase